jgi:hypothetical protein
MDTHFSEYVEKAAEMGKFLNARVALVPLSQAGDLSQRGHRIGSGCQSRRLPSDGSGRARGCGMSVANMPARCLLICETHSTPLS